MFLPFKLSKLVSVYGTKTELKPQKLIISCHFDSFILITRFLNYSAENEELYKVNFSNVSTAHFQEIYC